MSFCMFATIEIREYGEEPREQVVGPFAPVQGYEEDSNGAVDVLWDILTRQGDDVLRIEVEHI